MCTGVSNVMKSNLKLVNFEVTPVENPNITSYTPYCQNVLLDYDFWSYGPSSTYWLNVNTTASLVNIKDDTQQYLNISEYFQYPYNASPSITNNLLFLSLESLKFLTIIYKLYILKALRIFIIYYFILLLSK